MASLDEYKEKYREGLERAMEKRELDSLREWSEEILEGMRKYADLNHDELIEKLKETEREKRRLLRKLAEVGMKRVQLNARLNRQVWKEIKSLKGEEE